MSKKVEFVNNGKSILAANGLYKNFSAVLKPSNKSKIFAKPSAKTKHKNNLQETVDDNNFKLKPQLLMHEEDMHIRQAGRIVASIKQKQIDSYDELETYKKLLKKRKKRLIVRIFTFLLLLIVAPVIIFLGTIIIDKNSRHDFFGYNFYIVTTQSMKPEIMPNDCVVLSKVTDAYSLKIGDDIGYINTKGQVVIHRIEKIIELPSGQIEFETGGINNLSNDQLRVGFEQVVGKRVSTLRALGNAIIFFRSLPGIIVFFAIFASIMGAFYIAFRMSENIKYIENVE